IVMMAEVEEGNIFNVENLGQIYLMTQEMDRVYGVNHSQIDSIGHRTTRHLRVAAAGTLRSEPIMIDMPRTADDAADIRRIVHNSENVFGILVSLDDKAALVRANFIEGRLEYNRIFEEMNERVIAPFTEGWTGAQLVDVEPDRAEALKVEKGTGIIVKRIFDKKTSSASQGGLEEGDVITAINGKTAMRRWEISSAIIKAKKENTGPARFSTRATASRARRRSRRVDRTSGYGPPASRACTDGSTTTPATSSSSSSSRTASNGCCAGSTSTTGAARCVRPSPA